MTSSSLILPNMSFLTMAQNYHFLSVPSDLPAKYGVPLRLMYTFSYSRTRFISPSSSWFSYFRNSHFPHSHLPHLPLYLFHHVHGRKRSLHHSSWIAPPLSRLSPFDDSSSILLCGYLHHWTLCPDLLSSALWSIRNPYSSQIHDFFWRNWYSH